MLMCIMMSPCHQDACYHLRKLVSRNKSIDHNWKKNWYWVKIHMNWYCVCKHNFLFVFIYNHALKIQKFLHCLGITMLSHLIYSHTIRLYKPLKHNCLKNTCDNNICTFILIFIFCFPLMKIIYLDISLWKWSNKSYRAFFCFCKTWWNKKVIGLIWKFTYLFWCIVNVALLESRNITPHKNSYIYFYMQPIIYKYW